MGKLHTPVCVLGKQAWLGAGRSAFIPLTQKQNLRWEAEGGTSGLEAWNCPHRQPPRPQLGADWSFAGSRVSPGPCSQLIAQISGNESQPVRASGADGTHWGQLAEKALQRNPETSDRWKEPEADEDVLGGEVGVRWRRKEPRLQAGNKRPLGDYKLERQQIVNLSPS